MKCCKELKGLLKEVGESCFENSRAASIGKYQRVEFAPKSGKGRLDICKLDVDCMKWDSKTKKCDFVFCHCKEKESDYYFVEFKDNTNTDSAIVQLTTTIDEFKKKVDLSKKNTFGIIVATAVPKRSTRFQLEERRFADKYGTLLPPRSRQYIHKV